MQNNQIPIVDDIAHKLPPPLQPYLDIEPVKIRDVAELPPFLTCLNVVTPLDNIKALITKINKDSVAMNKNIEILNNMIQDLIDTKNA